MESIASKLKAKRESLNISLEQISKDTRISLHHLKSLESGRYADLPGGMYKRAIMRAYCDELGLDKNEILRRYDDEVEPRQEKLPVVSSVYPPAKSKTPAVAVWILILIFGTGLFLCREWIISALSPYFTTDYDKPLDNLPPERPPVNPERLSVNLDTDAKAADVHNTEAAVSPSPGGGDKAAEALPEQTVRSALNANNANSQPLRLEIVGREECWLSVDRDESGVVTKILSPGDVELFTAARTISLVIGNAGGVSLRINDRPARKLGQPGQVIRLTINKDTLQNLIDPSAS